MNKKWEETFEHREELECQSKLIKVKLGNIQAFVVNGVVAGFDINLRPLEEDGNRGISISLPRDVTNAYRRVLSSKFIHFRPEGDLMDAYQSAMGLYLHNLILRENKESGVTEAWFFTLSDRAEYAYYRVPIYVAVVYALAHQLQIEVEEDLLETRSIVGSLADMKRHLQPEISEQLNPLSLLSLMIEHEEGNRDFLGQVTDDDLDAALSLEELYKLRDKVVRLEKYEWAQRVTQIIKQREANEEG